MKIFFTTILTVFLFCEGQIFAQNLSLSEFEKSNKFKFGDQQISAIERINDEYFLIAVDKPAELLVVNGKTGEVKARPTSEKLRSGVDWEAMTKDENDFFYLIGSKQDFILRFKVDVCNGFKVIEDAKINIERTSILGDFQIEGLAVGIFNNNKKELIVGLREKSESGRIRAYFAVLTPGSNTPLKFAEKFYFDAGKAERVTTEEADKLKSKKAEKPALKESYQFHLSSLEYIPALKGFLIITSTEDNTRGGESRFFGNALWFVSDEDIEKKKFQQKNYTPLRTGVFRDRKKAEGFCLIPNMEKIYKLAMVFDNDNESDSELYFYKLDGLP